MLYMVTFNINIPPMLAYIAYMDPMGTIYWYIPNRTSFFWRSGMGFISFIVIKVHTQDGLTCWRYLIKRRSWLAPIIDKDRVGRCHWVDHQTAEQFRGVCSQAKAPGISWHFNWLLSGGAKDLLIQIAVRFSGSTAWGWHRMSDFPFLYQERHHLPEFSLGTWRTGVF